MKQFALILLFVFAAFLVAPTTIVLIKSTADVSLAFTVNEEESQGDRAEMKDKEVQLLSFHHLNFFSIKEDVDHFHSYKENYKHIFFDVLSPPPEFI